MSNSTARSGAVVATVATEKRPKYWPERAPSGAVEPERTKARPKPGLVVMSGKTEKTNWVEKEDKVVELEVGFIGIRAV